MKNKIPVVDGRRIMPIDCRKIMGSGELEKLQIMMKIQQMEHKKRHKKSSLFFFRTSRLDEVFFIIRLYCFSTFSTNRLPATS